MGTFLVDKTTGVSAKIVELSPFIEYSNSLITKGILIETRDGKRLFVEDLRFGCEVKVGEKFYTIQFKGIGKDSTDIIVNTE